MLEDPSLIDTYTPFSIAMTDDASSLFFTTEAALSPLDTNGVADLYRLDISQDVLEGDDQLGGGGGDDRLIGGPGADSLGGGNGVDWCRGSAGSDRYFQCETKVA